MRIICELNDKNVLGKEGRADAKPRLTSRAVLKDSNGMYAVMYSERFGLYSLPGGGVEEGEDHLAALKREIMEETGCTCDEIEELGCILENRAHCSFTQRSCYYIVTTNGEKGKALLTKSERSNRTCVQWHSLEKAIKLVNSSNANTNQRKFLRARDQAALKEYVRLLRGEKNEV